jgi:hypothetical protein
VLIFLSSFPASTPAGSGHKKILGWLPRISLHLTDPNRLAADERLVVVAAQASADMGSHFQPTHLGLVVVAAQTVALLAFR